MWMNLLAIAIVGIIGYTWAYRGFFSALIHLACTLAAGAVAFSVWEPLAYMILEKTSSQALIDIAWGAALLLPFALTLAALLGISAMLVRANAKLDNVPNWVGGAICGAGSGVITAGIVVLSLSMIRTPGDFFGYQPVAFDAQGSLVRSDSLWLPVDRITAKAYGMFSEASLATGEPLAKWHPRVADEGHLNRVGPMETVLKYAVKPGDIGLIGRYTVGRDAKSTAKVGDLIGDNKKVLNLDGDPVTGQAYVEGYVVQFKAGAREKQGQVIIGPGQVQLVLRSPDDTESLAVQPFAMVSQAKGDSLQLGRWRFDAKDVFLASAGSGADPVMTFEFLVPKVGDGGWQPVALYVKGLRFPLISPSTERPVDPFIEYGDSEDRNSAVQGGDIFSQAQQAANDMDESLKKSWNTTQAGTFNSPIRPSHRLPVRLNKGNIKDVQVGERNAIMQGEGTWRLGELLQRGDDKSLIVDQLDPGTGTVIVQVDVGPESPFSIMGEASDAATGAPVLIDTLGAGQRYEAIGFLYQDQSIVRFQFWPGRPITDKSQLPSLSRSRNDQKLTLLFRVSLNVSIKQYAIGKTVVQDLNPPMLLNQQQMVR